MGTQISLKNVPVDRCLSVFRLIPWFPMFVESRVTGCFFQGGIEKCHRKTKLRLILYLAIVCFCRYYPRCQPWLLAVSNRETAERVHEYCTHTRTRSSVNQREEACYQVHTNARGEGW